MLKKLIIGLVVVLAVVVVVVGVMWLQINRVVKFGVEKGGTRVLGVETTLDDADVSILGGSAALNGLTLGSPEGFKKEHMFHMTHARSSLDPWSLRGEEILIHEVVVDGADLVMEFKGTRTNWQVVMDRMESEEPEEEAPAEQKRMKIKRLVFSNGQVQVAGLPAKVGGTVKLPDIEMKNLGVGGPGLTARELLMRVIPRVIQEATKVLQQEYPELDVKKLSKDLQDLVNEKTDLEGTAQNAVEEGQKTLEGAVEGLLGGKKKEESE
jgi:uncharacterized protein involved in outer membrane biogenesis